jgi:ring-1,2-phenylacetyl-CoA epoxidase subunit PaaE
MSSTLPIQQLQVTAITQQTPDARTFTLQPLHGWQPVYQAGQFITLVLQTPHGEKRRSYSFSSAPVTGEPMQVTIKRVANGAFSRPLLTHTQVGDVWNSSGIGGFFTLPATPALYGQFVFLAAGSGITPCMSLIKTLLATTKIPILLIYSNHSVEDTIFYQQLQQMEQQYPQLATRFLMSNNGSVYNSRLSDWLLQQLLDAYLVVPRSNALFYMCGPFGYMQTVTISLLSSGVPLANLRKESFDTLPRITKPKPPDTDAHHITIHLNGDTYALTQQYPAGILAAAQQRGLVLPYSCEAGRCGSCAATCLQGNVWMAYNEVLLDEEIARGRILTCQGFAIGGDVEISFDV